MKKALVGMIGLLALAAATNAGATAIVDFTSTQALGSIGLGSHEYEFSNGPKSASKNSFLDTVSFTMNVAGHVQNFIDETENIASGLKISLFDVTNSVNPVSIFDCSGGSCGSSQNFGSLLKGDLYQLTFLGTITNGPGTIGDLEGHLNISAVPEASSLAMMFAGFGLLTFFSLRRRSI